MFRSIYYILTVFAVMTLASATAHAGGVAGVCGLGHNKSYSSPPTNNAYLCTQGIASSTAYSSGRWVWTCTGSDGSAPTSCSADNCGPAPVAGVCDNSTRNACSAGTANDAAVADTGTQYRWRCDGQNYGANSGICSMTIPPTPVAGVCNNSTRNACSAGAANDGAIADTASEYRWRCDGENGGANSGTCSLAKPPAPVAGVCNNSSQNACSAGTPNDAAAADTGTEYRWICEGQNGGANSATCSMAIPVACSAPPAPSIWVEAQGYGWEYNGSSWIETTIDPSIAAAYGIPASNPPNWTKPTGGPLTGSFPRNLPLQTNRTSGGLPVNLVQATSSTVVSVGSLPNGEAKCGTLSGTYSAHPFAQDTMCDNGIAGLGSDGPAIDARTATDFYDPSDTYWVPPMPGDTFNTPTEYKWSCATNDDTPPYNPWDHGCTAQRCAPAPATQSRCSGAVKSAFGGMSIYHYKARESSTGGSVGSTVKYDRISITPNSYFGNWGSLSFIAENDPSASQGYTGVSLTNGIYATGEYCIYVPNGSDMLTDTNSAICYVRLNPDGSIANGDKHHFCRSGGANLHTGGGI